jgi:beta-glucosidase
MIRRTPVTTTSFPPGFVWGVATASYQIEGAARVGGRGESIWDRFSHTPGNIANGDTGDVACDHYHRYPEDVAIIAGLGLDAYRFSVAWPRVVPDGTGEVNHEGLDFYDRLVDELLGAGITPYATLYHWDLPQALEDGGGWPSRATAEAFADYAAVVAARLGDRVPRFTTLNEPWCSSHLGYRVGVHAPGREDHGAALAAAHHLLLAHGLAVPAIRAAAPATEVGITLNFEPKVPASSHPLDVEAALAAHDQYNRWFLDPVAGRGYPAHGSAEWGWDYRQVADGDLEVIAAPIDFLGVNYYTRETVRSPHLDPLPAAPAPELTGMGWEVYPEGLTETLGFVASRTGELPLYVTENGAAYPDDPEDPGRDPERVAYLRRHLLAALAAIDDGVPLRGYFAWSLLDNFEWGHGYDQRFGVVHVDFATQQRTVRDSARYLAEVARSGSPA